LPIIYHQNINQNLKTVLTTSHDHEQIFWNIYYRVYPSYIITTSQPKPIYFVDLIDFSLLAQFPNGRFAHRHLSCTFKLVGVVVFLWLTFCPHDSFHLGFFFKFQLETKCNQFSKFSRCSNSKRFHDG
jgi:hypothetical protein